MVGVAPTVLPLGRLPKAVVSTVDGSATGSYECLIGWLFDQGLAALTAGLAARPSLC